MARHFVPSVAKRKGYSIPDKTVTAPLQRPMPHVRRISIGAVPKLTDMKRRHTVTLDRMVFPDKLHEKISEIIPGATVTVLGPTSIPADLVFITLSKVLPIHELLYMVNKAMENLP